MRKLGVASICIVAIFLFVSNCMALEIGQCPPSVVLKGKLGARLDGRQWSSGELRGKVSVLFYVDPDEKDRNNPASEALKKANFPAAKFQSYGIVNMASSWMPNFAINAALRAKQKRYPTTIYVRDYQRVLVKAWHIADENSDVLAFDRSGKLIFEKDGKLSAGEIQKLLQAVSDNL